ncbi:glycosyltransferase family 2 protein [Candidatus Parcubacteria bacterium]|nr:MAG: glycosyltransferase family 2 protein [Candidatus Parcubacteria bacterium]
MTDPSAITIQRPAYRAKPAAGSTARRNSIASILVLTATILVGIILVKAKTATDFFTHPVFYGYTIFITTFQLSRVGAAMLYRRANARVIEPDDRRYEPTVSIVIPCKNEEGAIVRTVLQSLGAQYPKDKLEVIVINDGSTDGTAHMLAELKRVLGERDRRRLVIVHWKQNRGKRHAMAEGFRRARGEIVVQLDSDSYIIPRTFRNLIAPFQHEDIGAVCAHADPHNADHNILTRMQAAYYFMSFRILKAAESSLFTVLCCSGCSSAYRKNAVMPILDDWLNERFLGLPVTWGDDRALTSWVLKRNYRTVYTDRARAYTIVPERFRQLVRQQIRWKKSWIINSLFTLRFMYRTQPFFTVTYFIPLLVITIATPFVAVRALYFSPLAYGILPLFYFLGIILMTSLVVLYYRILAPENRYWPYLYLWGALNTFFFSFLILYALLRIRDRGWGTR